MKTAFVKQIVQLGQYGFIFPVLADFDPANIGVTVSH